jgi:hypothetical protein
MHGLCVTTGVVAVGVGVGAGEGVGGVSVKVLVRESVWPLGSVTVKVTVFGPWLSY